MGLQPPYLSSRGSLTNLTKDPTKPRWRKIIYSIPCWVNYILDRLEDQTMDYKTSLGQDNNEYTPTNKGLTEPTRWL